MDRVVVNLPMQFLELLKEVEKAKVRYLVVGGIAVNLHGVIRPTQDIDFIVYLERNNLLRFIQLMNRLGYRPRVPVRPEELADEKKRRDWGQHKNMIVFSFYHPQDMMKVIDVFIKHPLPFEGMYKRRVQISLGDLDISVISIPDLIKIKGKANRLQDRSDIAALKQVMKEGAKDGG